MKFKNNEVNNMKKLEIYDSKGKVFDRYTVIISSDIYTMSRDPGSPQGVCMYHGTICDREYLKQHNTKISFRDLPEAVQAKIKELS
jgi:hypothetical protein